MPTRRPCSAIWPAPSGTAREFETPAVRRGWLDDGPGPSTRRGADDFVAVSWDELTELLADRAPPHRRHARQRGHLRRLLRMGQRGPLPPRPEPGPPVPETTWRIYVFATLLQPRRHRRHHAAGRRHPRRPLQALHGLGRGRREHRTAGVFRRRRREELGGQPRRHHRTPDPRRVADGSAPAADGSCPSARCGTTPTGDCEWLAPGARHRRRDHAGTGSRAGRRRPRRPRLPGRTYCTGYDRFERYLLGDDDGVPKSPQWAADDQRAGRRGPRRVGPSDGGAGAPW